MAQAKSLLDNAARHSPTGGTVEVSVDDQGLRVRDHGPGVHDADLPFVFDRFYRGAHTRGEQGSGLGLAIFIGLVSVIVGAASTNRAALFVGIAVCVLGVLEVTAREHFSGYRSHATLLAAVPAAGLVAASVAAFGTPGQRGTRELMLAAAVPVFGVLFWALRKRFRTARQARIVRPPVP